MKKGAVPQLTYAWWDKNKASTLPKTGLGAALKDYEAAKKKVNDKCSVDVLREARDKLYQVNETASAAIKKCNKTLHKETMEALERFDGVVKQEAKPLIDDIGDLEAELMALQQLQQRFLPIATKAKKEFDAIAMGLETALKQAESGEGSPKDVDRWLKLADAAEGLAKSKMEEARAAFKNLDEFLKGASKRLKAGHGSLVADTLMPFSRLIAPMDGSLGGIKSNARKLKAAADELLEGNESSEDSEEEDVKGKGKQKV
jgi:hypothetical protein